MRSAGKRDRLFVHGRRLVHVLAVGLIPLAPVGTDAQVLPAGTALRSDMLLPGDAGLAGDAVLAGSTALPRDTSLPADAVFPGDTVLPMDAALAAADSLLADAVARQRIPGAVFVVTRDGVLIHERAFGYAQLYEYGMRRLPEPRPMRTSTVFDLASVTKVMATTYALMLLVDRGLIEIDAPVHRYLPELRGVHLDSITVRHLLTHSAGLYQWQPLYYHASTPAQTFDVIRRMPLQWGVGEGRHYSDLGFMLLGYIVDRVGGSSLDAFVNDELYEPLGLHATSFLPKARGLTAFAATSHGNPYERRMVHDTAFGYDYDGDPNAWNGWREYTLSGEVSDGNAWYAHGGVAGHAGLFSTARDLAVLLEVLLHDGTYRGRRFLSPGVIAEFMREDRFGHRLGWQIPDDAPDGSFAHSGFTGTYVMGVPAHGIGIVLLINRENLGLDSRGYYPRLEVRQKVIRLVLDAADAGSDRERNVSRRGR